MSSNTTTKPQTQMSAPQQQQQVPVAQPTPPAQTSSPYPFMSPEEGKKYEDQMIAHYQNCYQVMRIIQIVICLFFVVLGIIFMLLFLTVFQDWKWKFFPYKKGERDFGPPDDGPPIFSVMFLLCFDLNFFIWKFIISSPFGLIGAAGEVFWCQVIHVVITCVPFFSLFYLPIPMFIACLMRLDKDGLRYHIRSSYYHHHHYGPYGHHYGHHW